MEPIDLNRIDRLTFIDNKCYFWTGGEKISYIKTLPTKKLVTKISLWKKIYSFFFT